ncbi:MAG: 6-bladed beta-propeller [Pseudarcicella sp.]|nr:6-bladed beta-propeller [Pseudarcicella sp.]MBP6410763.1 6-bladed beta-propeller [Pseudarcicella sp.]
MKILKIIGKILLCLVVIIVGWRIYRIYKPLESIPVTKVILNKAYPIIKIDSLQFQPNSLVKTIKYVALETKNECLIGDVFKTLIYKENIYILDAFQARCLFKFDINGKFIAKFNQIGEGPFEVTNIQDFSIDTLKNQIIVYNCDFQGKVLFLNINNLRPIKYKKISTVLDDLCPIGKGRYIGSPSVDSRNQYELQKFAYYVLDSNFNVVSKQCKHLYPNLYPGFVRTISKDDKMGTNFTTLFSNIVFQVMPQGALKLKYKIDFSKFLTPAKYMTDDTTFAKYRKKNRNTSGFYMAQFAENSEVATFRYMLYGQNIYEIFIQKKTGVIRHGFWAEDDYSMILPFRGNGSYKNTFFSNCDADIVYDRMQNKNFVNALSPTNRAMLSKVKIDDNPVLSFSEIDFTTPDKYKGVEVKFNAIPKQ